MVVFLKRGILITRNWGKGGIPMGILQSMFVKREFYKDIMESPKRRYLCSTNINLPMFTDEVIKFIDDTEMKINTCLNAFFYDLSIKIRIDKKNSNRSKLAFYNIDNPLEEYVIYNGEIKPTGAVVNNSIMDYSKNKREKIEKIFRYYETIVSSFTMMSIPLTSKVEFRYGFFEDNYFYMKDGSNLDGAKIYRVKKEKDEDTSGNYYFNLDELQDMFNKIIIPDEYLRSFERMQEFVNMKEQTVRNEVSIELSKQESKDVLERKLEQKYLDILEIQRELSEYYGEFKRITLPGGHLFVTIDGIKYIKKQWLPFLPYINLAKVDLRNVNISGIDFSYTNIKIDPQVVYDKDLRGCRFVSRSVNEWIFNKDTNFNGCKLDGVYIDDAPVKIAFKNMIPKLQVINRSEYPK